MLLVNKMGFIMTAISEITRYAINLTLVLTLIACNDSGDENNTASSSSYIKLTHQDRANEKSTIEVSVDSSFDLNAIQWNFSHQDIVVSQSSNSNSLMITLPSTDMNGGTFSIYAHGMNAGSVIETISDVQIEPITEVFSLNGIITDSPISEADITFNILNSDRKVQVTADIDGRYQTDIILDDDESSLIYIEALGKQNQSNAKLVRMIGDLRESKKNNPQEELKYNVTNLTTAEYALAKEVNNGETFSSYENYIEQAEKIDENTLLEVATIIKVIIDEPIKTPQTTLPSSVSDTLELVTKKDKREAFLYNVINTSQFSNAKKQMLADKEVISSQFKLPVGENYFIPINNLVAGFVVNRKDNNATLSSSTVMVDEVEVSNHADKVVIKAVSDLGFSLDNLSGTLSGQKGGANIHFCDEIIIRQVYAKKNNALVNVTVNCSDELGNAVSLTSQQRLYTADKTSYKKKSYVTQRLTKRHKLTLIQPPCHQQADCNEMFALTFNEEKEAFQLGDKTVNWNDENQTLFIRDNIELHFLNFLSERVDYLFKSNDRIYPASGRLLENIDNNAQGDLSGDYVVLSYSNEQQQSFLSMNQTGEAILWFVDSSAETVSTKNIATKYLANWVRNRERVTFDITEIQEFSDNGRVTYRTEQCQNESTCEKFADLLWDINGYVNGKIHLEQQARPAYSSNVVDPAHFMLVPTDNIDTFEAINQWHQWQGTDLPTPWTLFQTAQKNKNKESLTQLILTLPGLESLNVEHLDDYLMQLSMLHEIDDLEQLQQIIDGIDAKRLRHATAWDVIERAVINKDIEELKIQTLYDIDTLNFKEENFTDYLEAISNITLINNVEELQHIIDNIDSEKTLFLQTWQVLLDAWSNNRFSSITEDTIKPLKLNGIISEHFTDYLDAIAQLENLEQLTQVQAVIDNINQAWSAHNNALSSINEAINNSEFSDITSDTFADLIDFQYIEGNIEKYKERLFEQNTIENIEALQELIFNLDNELSDTSSNPKVWNEGVFFPSDLYKNYCATPREGIDPFTNQNYPDMLGSSLHEKLYLRSIQHEEYLWYDEINDTDPNSYPSTLSYFSSLKTPATLDNNLAKDRFHFSQTYEQYMSGFIERVVYGFGFNWSFLSTTAPRNFVLSYVDENSVASMAGVARGDKLIKINSIDVVNTNVYEELYYINETLFNPRDILYQFQFQSPSGELKTLLLRPSNETVSPVMHVKQLSLADNRVGYFMFNEFHASAQAPLISAFNDFSLNGVSDLIIDLRYNQGGLLYMASQLAYMIAGDSSLNRVFESLIYNDKNTHKNLDMYFINREIDWDQGVITNNILPTLNLDRVFILATGSTASASESLINGLRGIDVEVILIGEQTYGKPYGFLPDMNCGMVYYFVQFVGQNEKGYGDYTYGLAPVETETSEMGLSHQVQGCPVGDDLNFLLGTPDEPMLSNALNIMSQNQCVNAGSNATDIQALDIFIISSTLSGAHNQKTFYKLNAIPPWL